METETKNLIIELLNEGYDSGFISSELGISKKIVQRIKSQKYLPELNQDVASEEYKKERQLSKTQETQEDTNIRSNSTHDEKCQARNKLSKVHWRSINESELEGLELNTKQVCEEILAKLESNGRTDETFETIKDSLSQAQYKASCAHKEKRLDLPLRLRMNSSLLIHKYAITTLGSVGRKHSSKYRRIVV